MQMIKADDHGTSAESTWCPEEQRLTEKHAGQQATETYK